MKVIIGRHFPERHVRVELTDTCLEGRSLNRSAYDAFFAEDVGVEPTTQITSGT